MLVEVTLLVRYFHSVENRILELEVVARAKTINEAKAKATQAVEHFARLPSIKIMSTHVKKIDLGG